MKWNELSMADKAKYIQLGVQNGITSLDDIRDTYNSYTEGGYLENTIYKTRNGEFFIYANNKRIPLNYSNGRFITDDGRIYKPTTVEGQHNTNKYITNDEVVDNYINHIVYTMENPNSKGFTNGRWGKYTDKDSDGKTHINIGPGIESHSDVGANIDYNTTYSTQELNTRLRPDLLKKMEGIMSDLHEKYNSDADTMSMGNRLILLDIAHNVRPKGERNNMPSKWPNLVDGMMSGNTSKAKANTYSGNERRGDMRNELLWRDSMDNFILINK